MDKTNPLFAKFDQVLGKTTPTTSSAVPSRSNQVLAMERDNTPSSLSQVAKGNLGSDISSAVQNRGAAAYSDITSTEGNSNNPIVQAATDVSHGVHAVGNAFGAISDIGGALINHLIPQGVKDRFAQQTEDGKDNPLRKAVGDTASKAYDELGIRLNDFVNAHPELGKVLESTLRTAQGSGEVSGGILTGDMAAQGAQKAVDVGQQAVSKTQEIAGNIKDAVSGKIGETPSTDLQTIKERITPKPTAKEARLATDQGRLYKAKEPSLFKKGTVDKVAATDQQLMSSQTIQRHIPDAAKLDDPTLYKALDEKVSQISEELKPEMQKTPVKEETIQKINDDWTNLKKEQLAEAKATDEPNIKKWQKQFEKYLEKSKSDNMNDLWDSAKEYDKSIKPNVKNATDLSPEDLQTQKEIWLQNRSVLRSAINDSESGMGQTSRQAFSDMKDMYEGQNGLLSKAKIETKAAPSKITQFVKKHPVISTLGVSETGKKLITGEF